MGGIDEVFDDTPVRSPLQTRPASSSNKRSSKKRRKSSGRKRSNVDPFETQPDSDIGEESDSEGGYDYGSDFESVSGPGSPDI